MKHTCEHCYFPLDVMLVHRRVTPQQYCMSPVPIYTPGWQETKWSKETTQFRVGPRTSRPAVWDVNRSATHASRIVSTRVEFRECPWQYKLTWILNKYQSAVHYVYFFRREEFRCFLCVIANFDWFLAFQCEKTFLACRYLAHSSSGLKYSRNPRKRMQCKLQEKLVFSFPLLISLS